METCSFIVGFPDSHGSEHLTRDDGIADDLITRGQHSTATTTSI